MTYAEQVICEGIADTQEDAGNVVKILESEGLIDRVEFRGMNLRDFLFQYCTVWNLPEQIDDLLEYTSSNLEEKTFDRIEEVDLIKLEEDKFLLVDESFNY